MRDRLNNSLGISLQQQDDHSHICGFYEGGDERLEILAAYYKVGLERGELCIFVTDQAPDKLIHDLNQHGLDIAPAIEENRFRIFPVMGTYAPDNTFKSLQMLNNLRNFVKKATNTGYRGVRGGGDMEWLGAKVHGWESVVDYESKINRFIRNSMFTGLCLFPRSLLNTELTQKIVQTHQLMIRSGKLVSNPYYIPPEQSYKLNISIIAEVETWLDELDEKESRAALA